MFHNKVDMVAFERIRKDFFDGNPVSAEIKIEGYEIKDGKYVLGCLAGPVYHLSHMIHEMGHLAEREIPKLLEKPNCGWGY